LSMSSRYSWFHRLPTSAFSPTLTSARYIEDLIIREIITYGIFV
jgi:hypothetical protein